MCVHTGFICLCLVIYTGAYMHIHMHIGTYMQTCTCARNISLKDSTFVIFIGKPDIRLHESILVKHLFSNACSIALFLQQFVILLDIPI